MPASILASGVTPQETRTFLLRSLPALFIGTDTPAVWVRDSANPSLSFFVAKSPEDALQWIRQSCRPEVFPQLEPKPKQGREPVNPDDAIPDSQPPTKRARNHTAAPEPEYIITVGNINRRKERERRKKLENTLSDVFVTEEE